MKRMSVSEFRLMLAVGLCAFFFIATPSSPTSSDSCYEHKDHGSIIVDNPNEYTIKIQIFGKGEFTIPKKNSRNIIDFKPGEYMWTAIGEYDTTYNYHHKTFWYGQTKVEKDKTSRIYIPKRDPV